MHDTPLSGKRVLVTRPRGQAGSLAELLEARGARVAVMPLIEITPPSDPLALERVVCMFSLDPAPYDWLVFTSANGVERFIAEAERLHVRAAACSQVRVAAVGPSTAAAIERFGITPALVAREHRQEGLARELLDYATTRGRADDNSRAPAAADTAALLKTARPSRPIRALVARAETARDALPNALREAGWLVDTIAVYKTVAVPREVLAGMRKSLELREFDAVVVTSPSGVASLCDALGEQAAAILKRVHIASIGPVTTEAATSRGLLVAVEPESSTAADLVAALERFFDSRRPGDDASSNGA